MTSTVRLPWIEIVGAAAVVVKDFVDVDRSPSLSSTSSRIAQVPPRVTLNVVLVVPLTCELVPFGAVAVQRKRTAPPSGSLPLPLTETVPGQVAEDGTLDETVAG
jgi:hypothetical protein